MSSYTVADGVIEIGHVEQAETSVSNQETKASQVDITQSKNDQGQNDSRYAHVAQQAVKPRLAKVFIKGIPG